MGRFIDRIIWLVGFAALSYAFFFVPLGKRTLFQHTRALMSTPEARELQAEAEEAADRLRVETEREWSRRYGDSGPPDASVRP